MELWKSDSANDPIVRVGNRGYYVIHGNWEHYMETVEKEGWSWMSMLTRDWKWSVRLAPKELMEWTK